MLCILRIHKQLCCVQDNVSYQSDVHLLLCLLKTLYLLLLWTPLKTEKKKKKEGFPGGSVLKNLPANAGHMGLIPGPGRSHMPRDG